MKKHDVKTEDNFLSKGLHDWKTEENIGTNEEQISCTDEELKKKVCAKMKEFNRKIELGQKLNEIMDKHGFNENGLDNDMMVALKTYKLYGKNMDLAKKVLARIKKFERNIKLGNNLKITVDKHGYNVNELPQDMKDASKTYDKLPQHMKDDLKTYEGMSRNMVETLKNYEKLSQHIKDGLKTKQKVKKRVWYDEPSNQLHDKK